MGRVKRGGFVFLTWIGDHQPRHVHIIKDGRMILKWDLDNERIMEGEVNQKALRVLDDLRTEGLI
jgi:hypothetical protein